MRPPCGSDAVPDVIPDGPEEGTSATAEARQLRAALMGPRIAARARGGSASVAAMGLQIERIPTFGDNYTYLVICDETRDAAIVDAPEDDPVVERVAATGADVKLILSTHHHLDHSMANPAARRALRRARLRAQSRTPSACPG